MKIQLPIILLSMIIISCGGKSKSINESEVSGKYLDRIEHYQITFEDNSTYDLNEKETAKLFYLIRHAEKDTIKSTDPPLSEKGLLRSRELANIMENAPLDAVYSTMTQRTLFTVDSIADVRGMVTYPYDVRDFRELSDQLIESLDIHRALIVGHSNTIPVMVNYLLGEEYYHQSFDESDYDNFIIIKINTDGTKSILPLKYH